MGAPGEVCATGVAEKHPRGKLLAIEVCRCALLPLKTRFPGLEPRTALEGTDFPIKTIRR